MGQYAYQHRGVLAGACTLNFGVHQSHGLLQSHTITVRLRATDGPMPCVSLSRTTKPKS